VAVHIFMKGERMSRRRAMKVLSATHAPLDGLSDCSVFWSMGWQPKWQTRLLAFKIILMMANAIFCKSHAKAE